MDLVHTAAGLSCWHTPMCRASLPVVTALVAVFVESKTPSRNEALSLLLLTGGVCITIFEGNAMGNLSGLSLAFAGMQQPWMYAFFCC